MPDFGAKSLNIHTCLIENREKYKYWSPFPSNSSKSMYFLIKFHQLSVLHKQKKALNTLDELKE